MKNAEWLLKQGIKFDDVYLTAPANYTYVIEDKTGRKLGSADNSYSEISAFQKWLDAEHVEPILDEVEKRYLSAVIKPFRDKVQGIKKFNGIYVSHCFDEILVYYESFGRDLWFSLPPFEKGTMYKGMVAGKVYSLKELGL